MGVKKLGNVPTISGWHANGRSAEMLEHGLSCEHVLTMSDDYPRNANSGILNDEANYVSVDAIQLRIKHVNTLGVPVNELTIASVLNYKA